MSRLKSFFKSLPPAAYVTCLAVLIDAAAVITLIKSEGIWGLLGLVAFLALLLFASVVFLISSHLFQRAEQSASEHGRVRTGFFAALTHEMGMAGIVAFWVTVAFELYTYRLHERERAELMRQHEEDRKAIKADALGAMFDFHVDPRLKDAIGSLIKTSNVVREQVILTYSFQPYNRKDPVPGDNLLRLRTTVFYRIRNNGELPSPLSLRPLYRETSPDAIREAKFTEFNIDGASEGPVHLKGNALETERQPAPGQPAVVEFRPKIQDNPRLEVTIPAQAEVSVSYTYENVVRERDDTSWTTLQPTERLLLQVKKVGHLPKLAFLPTASRIPGPPATKSGPQDYEWAIDAPLLPYQGIVLRWFPEP